MNAREFLNTVRKEQREIIQLHESIIQKRYTLFPGAIRYDKDLVQTTPEDQMSKAMAEIADMEHRLILIEENLRNRQALADELLGKVRDLDARRVARLYYRTLKKDGFLPTVEDVANEEGCTDRHIHNLLNRAQVEVDAICNRSRIKLN